MSTTYRTCTHLYDTGGTCNSAAVKDQKYCTYHLRHRARLMRMAQARARSERFDLKLPPLESMQAVQSAVSQLAEALAADMIDLKRADRLFRVLSLASRNLLKADKWPASPYHTEVETLAIDLAAEYGLPPDTNLDTPLSVILSESRSDESKDPFFSDGSRGMGGPQLPAVGNCGNYSTGDWQPATGNCTMPFSGNYCGTHHSRQCDCLRIRPDYPVTPEMIEVFETTETHGPDVAAARSKQLMRNAERRRLNRDRKRYAAIALEHNMRRAADKMAERKLAERAQQDELAAKKPPASVTADSQIDRQSPEKAALTPTG